ncbi:hypothetical protein ACFLXQ_01485 [Chloroflexota bacterium]
MARRNKGKATVRTYMVRCTGMAQSGKSTLAIEFAKWYMERLKKTEVYVVNNDNRLFEYELEFGPALVGVDDVVNQLVPREVFNAVKKDVQAGEFKRIAALIYDNLTNPFKAEATNNAGLKARAMADIINTLLAPQVPVFAISHIHMAAKEGNLQQQRKRESVSDTELSRMAKAFNLELETLYDQAKDRFGVKVLKWRYKRDLEPFIVWDEAENFHGIFDKIEAALQQSPAPETNPDDYAALLQYNEKNPFSQDKDAFKSKAGQICMAYFVEHDGHKFFAFGSGQFGTEPTAEVAKKNGEQGVNGAHNHFLNTYEKVRSGGYPDIPKPKTFGEMTFALRKYTEDKIKGRIEEYEAAKKPDPAPAEVEPEPEFEL